VDEQTFNHFWEWVNHTIHADENVALISRMISMFNEDPTYWADKEWHLLMRAAENE
jgi:hypothetical protein